MKTTPHIIGTLVRTTFAITAALALGVSAAQAAPVTVSNSSFENPVVSEFTWIGTTPGTPNLGGTLPGWNWAGGGPNYSALQPSGGSDGAQSLYLNGARAYQDFNIATAGWTYTLSVDAERRAGGLTLWFEAWDPFDETNTYVITTLAFDTSTLPDAGWNTVSLQYTIPGLNDMDPNSILRISLQAPGTDAIVDNVRLDAVPEPSTFAMLLGGVGSLLLLRRRRS